MKRKERHHLKENELIHTIEVVRNVLESRQREVTAVLVAVVLIVVAVVIETIKQIDSQLTMREYEGL